MAVGGTGLWRTLALLMRCSVRYLLRKKVPDIVTNKSYNTSSILLMVLLEKRAYVPWNVPQISNRTMSKCYYNPALPSKEIQSGVQSILKLLLLLWRGLRHGATGRLSWLKDNFSEHHSLHLKNWGYYIRFTGSINKMKYTPCSISLPYSLTFTNPHSFQTLCFIPSVVMPQNQFTQIFEIVGRFYMHFYQIGKT